MLPGSVPSERRFTCPNCTRRFKTTGGLLKHGRVCLPKALREPYRQAIKAMVLK